MKARKISVMILIGLFLAFWIYAGCSNDEEEEDGVDEEDVACVNDTGTCFVECEVDGEKHFGMMKGPETNDVEGQEQCEEIAASFICEQVMVRAAWVEGCCPNLLEIEAGCVPEWWG